MRKSESRKKSRDGRLKGRRKGGGGGVKGKSLKKGPSQKNTLGTILCSPTPSRCRPIRCNGAKEPLGNPTAGSGASTKLNSTENGPYMYSHCKRKNMRSEKGVPA